MKMIKNIKKTLTFFVLAFFIINIETVFAAAPPRLDNANLGTLDKEQATITISQIDAGDQLAAYKILDVYKNAVTNEINYRYTDSFYAFLEAGGAKGTTDYSNLTEEEYFKLTSGDIASGSTQTSSTLDKLASEYAYYIIKNNIIGNSMSNSGTTASLTTDTGSYLILPTSTNRLYAVMVANLDYEVQNGVWTKQNDSIVAKVSDPSIKMSIGKIGQDKASFFIGNEYNYFIEVTVPPYPTNSENYLLNITADKGKGISINSIEVKDGDNILSVVDEPGTMDGISYEQKLLDSNNNLVGIFSDNSLIIDRRNLTSSNLLIKYAAFLNDSATVCRKTLPEYNLPIESINLQSNDAGAVLSYYSSYNNSIMSYISSTYAFTYKAEVNNFELGNPDKKIKGAVFDVYTDSALTEKVNTFTTDDNGSIIVSGLAEGIWYLKEVKAAPGYSLYKDVIEVNVQYDDSNNYCGPVINIPHTKISALPITGGMGTIIFTIVGILLIGSAVVGITYYKKKNKISA